MTTINYIELEGYAVHHTEQGGEYLGVSKDLNSSEYPEPLQDGDTLSFFANNKAEIAFYEGVLKMPQTRQEFLLTQDTMVFNNQTVPHVVPSRSLHRLFAANCYIKVKRITADQLKA